MRNFTGRMLDIVRGHDANGTPIDMPERKRQAYIQRWKEKEAPRQDTTCVHRGGVIESRTCTSCGSKGEAYDVRHCVIHEQCSDRNRVKGLHACSTCEQYADVPPTLPVANALVSTAKGFLVGRNGDAADGLRSSFRGSVVLACGGPSLTTMDLSKLKSRGVVVAAVNNAATVVRPDIWFSVDDPKNFHEGIWRDPAIMKFTKRKYSRSCYRTRGADGKLTHTKTMTRDCPNVFFYDHCSDWDENKFLTMPQPTWGTDKTTDPHARGTRSVMLVALRMLHWLGFNRVIIIGADFGMTPEASYAFDEPKDKRACGTNNNTYSRLNEWFTELLPHFASHGYSVLNATPVGNLDAFPRVSFDEVVEEMTIPDEMLTRGYYVT